MGGQAKKSEVVKVKKPLKAGKKDAKKVVKEEVVAGAGKLVKNDSNESSDDMNLDSDEAPALNDLNDRMSAYTGQNKINDSSRASLLQG